MDDNKKNIPSGLDGTFDKRDLLCDRGRGGRAVHGLDLFEVLYAANAVGHIVDHLAILEHSAVSFHLALDGAETVAEGVVEERNHFIVHCYAPLEMRVISLFASSAVKVNPRKSTLGTLANASENATAIFCSSTVEPSSDRTPVILRNGM